MAIAKSQQTDKKAYALANLAKVGITEELAMKKVTQLFGWTATTSGHRPGYML